MALASAVKGGLRPSQIVTWERDGTGTAEPLTGATLTGWIRDRSTGTTRAIAGTLTVTDAVAGEFRWDYAAGDVNAAGQFDVQFNAAFPSGQTPARTFTERWEVKEALA
jgi:hypothetical protein